MQAIGYRQVVEYLRDEHSLTETIELVKSRTQQFAKRQLTWFRRHGQMEWIELKPGGPLETIFKHHFSHFWQRINEIYLPFGRIFIPVRENITPTNEIILVSDK
jgi:hypothetical protein